MTTNGELFGRIQAEVDARRDQLLDASHAIHAQPELGFQEHRASALLAEALEQGGFVVERGVGNLPTAFRAELAGTRPGPTIAILAEYDALPEIGHACGHNIIATAALGAGLALADTSRMENGRGAGNQAGGLAGRVVVIGTPAEEGGGGKILLAQAGVFDDVDAAVMMHPSTRTMVSRGSLANGRIDVIFHGKAAHAASSPDLGINALDAVIQTFVGLNARRLGMRADARVHGIITHGGDAVNIIPARAAAKFSVRARDRAYQQHLVHLLREVAEGAAMATGARLEWKESRGYDNMIPNPTIANLCQRALEALGVPVVAPVANERMGSTDMGDISQLLPAIHAYLAIAPEGTAGHSTEFAAAAISAAGDAAVLNGAKCLAMTVAELIADPATLAQAKADYQTMLAAGLVAGRNRWLASRAG